MLLHEHQGHQAFNLLNCNLLQVNVPFSDDTHIQCMQNTSSEIDYFVSVGSTTRIEEMLENHPVSTTYNSILIFGSKCTYFNIGISNFQMLVGDISTRTSPSVITSQPQSSEVSTPEEPQTSDTGM